MINAKTLKLLGFVLASPFALQASSSGDGFLLKADTMKAEAGKGVVATGRAAVITGEVRITAEQIAFDEQSGILKFYGDAVIHTGGSTLTARELAIDVRGKRMFMLSNGNIVTPAALDSSKSQIPSLEFTREFPKSETQLRRIEIKF